MYSSLVAFYVATVLCQVKLQLFKITGLLTEVIANGEPRSGVQLFPNIWVAWSSQRMVIGCLDVAPQE